MLIATVDALTSYWWWVVIHSLGFSENKYSFLGCFCLEVHGFKPNLMRFILQLFWFHPEHMKKDQWTNLNFYFTQSKYEKFTHVWPSLWVQEESTVMFGNVNQLFASWALCLSAAEAKLHCSAAEIPSDLYSNSLSSILTPALAPLTSCRAACRKTHSFPKMLLQTLNYVCTCVSTCDLHTAHCTAPSHTSKYVMCVCEHFFLHCRTSNYAPVQEAAIITHLVHLERLVAC